MQALITLLKRQVALILLTSLAVPATVAQTASQAPREAVSTTGAHARSQHPGVVDLRYEVASVRASDVFPDSPGTTRPQASGPGGQAASTQPAQDQQQSPVQQPVGTAAAPDEKPEGASASRPAGAAIAPAKQHRIRTLSIRIALLVGAGVAIGVVTAASLSSPSRAN